MKLKITRSDMITRATQKAETEFLRQSERKGINQLLRTGDLLVSTFELVTGESIEPESDRDQLADLVSMHECY